MIAAMHRTIMVVALLASASLASAQDPAAPLNAAPAAPQRAVPTLPTPQETFGAIGRLIDQSISSVGAGVNAGVKGAGAAQSYVSGMVRRLPHSIGVARPRTRLRGTEVLRRAARYPLADLP